MIKTVIIDDELHIRNAIREKLERFFNDDILVIGEAESVQNGVKIINTLKPDLLLLDIELTDGSSFEILDKIDLHDVKLIFITGFNEHAIKAIKLGAIDYLLKPIDDAEFEEALKRVIVVENSKVLKEQVGVSSDFYQNKSKKRIVLKTQEAHFIVKIGDILFCHSEGNYTTFYLTNKKKVLISKPLKKAIELISDDNFIRTHQSYLVNLDYVEKYLPEGYVIILEYKIPVAGRRKEILINKINRI